MDPTIRLRDAAAADLDALQRFVAALSPHTRRQRFFVPLAALPAPLARALQASDPAHRFVLAESPQAAPGEILGWGLLVADPSGAQGELALVVGDRWQGRGLGRRLLARLLGDARAAGLREAVIETLRSNQAMRALARRCGFQLQHHPEDAALLLGRRALAAAG